MSSSEYFSRCIHSGANCSARSQSEPLSSRSTPFVVSASTPSRPSKSHSFHSGSSPQSQLSSSAVRNTGPSGGSHDGSTCVSLTTRVPVPTIVPASDDEIFDPNLRHLDWNELDQKHLDWNHLDWNCLDRRHLDRRHLYWNHPPAISSLRITCENLSTNSTNTMIWTNLAQRARRDLSPNSQGLKHRTCILRSLHTQRRIIAGTYSIGQEYLLTLDLC